MTKRRAEDVLFCGIPSKICYDSLCNLDMTSGAVDPPSLLAVLGSRCRKRRYSFEEPDVQQTVFHCKPATDNPSSPSLNGSMAESSRSHPDRQSSSRQRSAKKRPRFDDDEDGDGSQKTFPKSTKANDDKNLDNDDVSYNYFQFWRIPLPAVDLSLLEDAVSNSESRNNATVKDPAHDAMET